MIKFLWRILWGKPTCEHKWKKIQEVKVYAYDFDKLPIGTTYHLQCENCGDIVQRKIRN